MNIPEKYLLQAHKIMWPRGNWSDQVRISDAHKFTTCTNLARWLMEQDGHDPLVEFVRETFAKECEADDLPFAAQGYRNGELDNIYPFRAGLILLKTNPEDVR